MITVWFGRWPNDADHLASLGDEVHAAQDLYALAAQFELFSQVVDFYNWGIHSPGERECNEQRTRTYLTVSSGIKVLSDDAIIFVVLANPIPIHIITLQDAQSTVVTPDADRHLIAYTLKAQPRQIRVFAPQLVSFSYPSLYVRRQCFECFSETRSGVRVHRQPISHAHRTWVVSCLF